MEVYVSGIATNWITFQAAPGSSPIIQIPDLGTNAEGGFHIAGASYIKIDGFEVIGTSKLITPQQAAFNDGTQAILNSDCVSIDGTGRFPGIKVVHDVIITNMKLHDCAGGGVAAQGADALTITYNQIYGNGFWTVFDTSGIDLFHLTDAPGSSTQGGYKNVIAGNTVFGNHSNFPSIGFLPVEITDGNGMIIDDNMHMQAAKGKNDVQGVPYTGRTYIASNILYSNGGRGIHVYESAHVDIANNTTYNDMLSNSPGMIFGEIDAQSSADINIVNNVAININNKMIDFNDNSYSYSFNLWDGSNVPFVGTDDVVGVAMLTDPANANFTPTLSSPAVASGTTTLSPTLDVTGRVRRTGHIDRGAVQVTP
ncbi:MAG: right-handed parallel beta-helix repeat-containing protein [Pseudomonadota bacterium]|nr:right-handed parallel beta-helix repeat-containing protein [Pseudomonadota bacterium]